VFHEKLANVSDFAFFFKVLESAKYVKSLLTFSVMFFIEVARVFKNNKAAKTKKQLINGLLLFIWLALSTILLYKSTSLKVKRPDSSDI
jgi:hypothetical protein